MACVGGLCVCGAAAAGVEDGSVEVSDAVGKSGGESGDCRGVVKIEGERDDGWAGREGFDEGFVEEDGGDAVGGGLRAGSDDKGGGVMNEEELGSRVAEAAGGAASY